MVDVFERDCKVNQKIGLDGICRSPNCLINQLPKIGSRVKEFGCTAYFEVLNLGGEVKIGKSKSKSNSSRRSRRPGGK
jgi:hypothetical protein